MFNDKLPKPVIYETSRLNGIVKISWNIIKNNIFYQVIDYNADDKNWRFICKNTINN